MKNIYSTKMWSENKFILEKKKKSNNKSIMPGGGVMLKEKIICEKWIVKKKNTRGTRKSCTTF